MWRTGNTFHYVDASRKAHLYVIICQDGDIPSKCVTVNITTIHNDLYDKSYVLDAGDHPFIKKPSSVFYKGAYIDAVESLERARRRGEIWRDDDIDTRILVKMQRIALISPMTRNEVKDFLKKYLKI